jgi:hypothetical protein
MTLGDIIRMEEVIKKLVAERGQAKAEGAAEEREKIVAWLRESADWHDAHDDGLSGFDRIAQADRESANLIEAKDYLK